MLVTRDHAIRLGTDRFVWIVEDVPKGVVACLRAENPSSFSQRPGGRDLSVNTNYLSQRVLRSAEYTVGPTGSTVQSRQSRTLDFATPNDGSFEGQSRPLQLSAWTPAVAPAAVLVPSGRREHVLDTALNIAASELERFGIYCRLVGTAVAAEDLREEDDPTTNLVGDGVLTRFRGRLLNVPVIPGSVSLSTTIGSGPTAVTAVDDRGDGVLVGVNVRAGSIDYLTGIIDITFADFVVIADTLSVDYEEGATDPVGPVDLHLEFLSQYVPDRSKDLMV